MSLKPRCSNLLMMFPTRPRWTPSGYSTKRGEFAALWGTAGTHNSHLDHDVGAFLDRHVV